MSGKGIVEMLFSCLASTDSIIGSPCLITTEEAKFFENVGGAFTLICLSPLPVSVTVFGSQP